MKGEAERPVKEAPDVDQLWTEVVGEKIKRKGEYERNIEVPETKNELKACLGMS